MVAITYFCPVAKNHPIGGVKVIHQHVSALAGAGVDCAMIQPMNKNERTPWFESHAPMRTSNAFDPKRDFLVIPESWAGQFSQQCYEQGIKYAIFVQNGYSICDAVDEASLAEIRQAYTKAALILSISDDTTAMVSLAYPSISADRIVQVSPRVDDLFAPGEKSKIISYMPRKLPAHATLLRHLLHLRLPQGWDVVSVEKQDKAVVAQVLSKSSIFLSLCDREGFGLPPLEAAVSGALVVGYTGQGANEYFQPPNFRKIANGDFKSFVEEILRAVDDVNTGLLQSPAFHAGLKQVKARYSRENELKKLLAFVQKAEELTST